MCPIPHFPSLVNQCSGLHKLSDQLRPVSDLKKLEIDERIPAHLVQQCVTGNSELYIYS